MIYKENKMEDEDVINKKFEWNRGAVQHHLNEWYSGINIDSLNNYQTCGRKYTDASRKYNGSTEKPEPDSYFKLVFGKLKPPRDRDRCICGQHIQEQCYICPKDNIAIDTIIIVGNECIDKFTEISIKGRRCETCGALHKNRNFNLCNEHIDIKNKISKKYNKFVELLLYREYTYNLFIHKVIKNKKRNKSNIYNLMLITFYALKPSKYIKSWKGLMSNMIYRENRKLSLMTKCRNDNRNIIFYYLNLFKLIPFLNKLKITENALPLDCNLQYSINQIKENQQLIFPYGKLGGKSFKEFYKLSDYGYRQYFLNSKEPNYHTRLLQKYITNCYKLEEAGYKFI